MVIGIRRYVYLSILYIYNTICMHMSTIYINFWYLNISNSTYKNMFCLFQLFHHNIIEWGEKKNRKEK